jgi:hypothetical protein
MQATHARRTLLTLLSLSLLLGAGTRAYAQQTQSLAELRFDIVGVRLVVDPPALTVPKNIPTHVNTSLVVPAGAPADVRDALATLTAGAVVEAELRGPSIPATRISVAAGSPIPLPAFALPGDYFLDGIRLARDGVTILDATTADGHPATTIPIKVISEVFVTSVTSRPLSADEIRQKGILIDASSFQTVNFQVALNVDGQKFTIDMPAVLPTPRLLQASADRQALIQQVGLINQRLAETQTRLPAEFDRPGINFSIAALPFFFVPEDEGGIPTLDVPPITGLVVVAGNVAFLHQFFKVAVMVNNVAPDGSALELRDVTGTIALPTGLDRVAGTPDQPGDDPLRLARIEGVPAVATTPIVQPGPDGQVGTADDLTVVPPQKPAEGEFLLEGLKEGGHTFDVEIAATLDGLPSGPVRLTGHAAGAVFVRNPTFAVTLAHPRTIRSGESYQLYATVTNTSRSVANLVSVNLDPLSISGAQLQSDATVTFQSIAAGESATARFTLLSQRTGEVTFSSLTGDAAAGGGITLFTGVGERGVPLAPNAIVLPAAVDALPAARVAAALRVLGQAFSIATAPADALPQGVAFVKRQTVIDRGLELAQAGERVRFGEPLGRVAVDLLLDWLGNDGFDGGFDQLMRETDAGSAFLRAIESVTADGVQSAGGLEYQRGFAQVAASRAQSHLSAVVGAPAGSPAPALTVRRADGAVLIAGGPGSTTIPGAAALRPIDSVALAVLGAVEPIDHIVEFTAPAAGAFDFGLDIPAGQAGASRQLRFPAVALAAGAIARVVLHLPDASGAVLEIDADGNGVVDATRTPQITEVSDAAPHVLTARQLQSSFGYAPGDPDDPATYGLLVGVLFDKPVTQTSAELKTAYAIEANTVIGAALQHGGRLVYLYLQKPIGALKPRTLQASGISDVRGGAMSPESRPIAMVLDDGGHVFGQVREAGGQPVPDALLRLTIVVDASHAFDAATVRADANGSFDFDFVPRIGQHFLLTAQHPRTRDVATLTARIRGAGEELLLNPTFTGLGTVRGRLIGTDGIPPLPEIPVALIPGAVFGSRGFTARTNGLGEFLFQDVPVGIFTLTASDGVSGFGQIQGLIASAGQSVLLDLPLVTQPSGGGRLVGRVFLGDGSTPARGFTVYVGSYSRRDAVIGAVDTATTTDDGSFSFARTLPPGGYDVVAVDTATQQIGVTHADVSARLTTSVSVVLEATGAVEGVVFNAQGQPVAGAVIAGGLALGSSDANGFFRIDGVPAGARTIQAGDPVTRRRGAATVTLVPGQTVRVAITLEARATITGRVLDANGTPMPRVSVRIPQIGGFTFVFTNSDGVYTFPDLALGSYLIQAPGPSVDSLIGYMEANGMDPESAFTSGDGTGASAPPPTAGDANAVLAAYQEAVKSFVTADETLAGLPMAALGGFGWNRVQLFQDSTIAVADVKFLSQGRVAGRTEDSNARPTGALVRIIGLSVSPTGAPTQAELGRTKSDAATGAFAFSAIPRFDLATFQAAGVRGGDFTVEAAQPFSPAIASLRDQLNTTTPDRTDVVLRFPSAAVTNGTLSGRVFLPDGTTPAPRGTQVQINFGDLAVTTADDGTFHSLLPIPAGNYTVTAIAANGLRGRAVVVVPAGGNVDVEIRLLGLGAVTIDVRRPNGVPVVNALVRLERSAFPFDQADGHTDAAGRVHFVNITEGSFGIVAEEQASGLTGRASGVVVRDADVTVPLTITASGRVTGRFLSADGSQSIPFAQVALTTGSVQAFATTDANGGFDMTAVPIGRLTVEAHDPLTGRLGRTSSELVFEGQAVDVTIRQLPRGTVSGVVLNADGVTIVAAARVEISSSSVVQTSLQAVARADGGFRFEGVPEGTFTIVATDPVSGFAGRATGRITGEGEVVDLAVTLAPFGALEVSVHDVADAPIGNATVSITGPVTRSAAVDQAGAFAFEHLPLGSYTISAVSLADPGNGGRAQATIASANERATGTVRLRGTGQVAVTVVAADGVTRVVSAAVTLAARAASGGDTPGPTAGTLNGFTDGNGAVTFASVPVGDFFVRAEAAALGGVGTGALSAAGSAAAVTVRLGAAGSIAGRVLLPDGVTPAARAIVTLRFQSQTQTQSGVVQVTTDLGGLFRFAGIPVGTFTLSAFEVVSSAVRNATGAIASNGQAVPLGDLVLDNAAPRIVSVDPADRASGVAAGTSIAVTFAEPMDGSSVEIGGSTANVALLEGGNRVTLAAPILSDGNRTVTLRPTAPLKSGALYTFSVRGGPDGPTDESGFTLLDSFVSTFTVRDTIAPAVVSISPAAEARGILPEATVRVTLSETLSRGTLVLRDASGAVVPGLSSLTAGNTAVVFSPQQFLLPNTFYVVTLANVADTAGNPLTASVTARFFTVDTLAPVVTALQIAGSPRAGSPITLQPVVTGDDVARVEFRSAEGAAQAVSTAPFAASFTLPSDRSSTTFTVVAVDATGNRSAVFEQTVAIQANAPPVAVLTNLTGGTDVRQGQTVTFEVRATDDAGLAQVLFSTVGAVTLSTSRTVSGGQTAFVATFDVVVPPAATSGVPLTVQAAAIDTAGLQSAAVTLSLVVRDGNKPAVTFVAPVNNAVVIAGQPLDVVVDASDDVSIASVALVCNPTAAGCESRTVTAPSTRQTFAVTIPSTLQAPQTFVLSVIVTDTAGNATAAGRVVQIADGVKPVVTALQPVSGATRVVAGQNALLRAQVSDNVGVVAALFTTDGAFTSSGTVAVSPPLPAGLIDLPLAVPSGLANGATFAVHVRARDAAGNLSDEAALQLTVGDNAAPAIAFVSPAAGSAVIPGQTVTVQVRATDDVAVTRVNLAVSGVLSRTDSVAVVPASTPATVTFIVPVPSGTAAGALVLTVEAIDATGVASGPVQRTLNVADVVAPQVRITNLVSGASVDPRVPIAPIVEASDSVGVTAITFSVSGAVASTETRPIAPAATTKVETFAVAIAPPPISGGALTLTATATDAAGNTGSAGAITLHVLDVVAPDVASTDPTAGATKVDPGVTPTLTFTEPIDRNTLTGATVQLRRGATAIPAAIAVAPGDAAVTLTPLSPLATNATFTLTVTTGVRDVAGNPIAADRQFSFTTSSPDTVAPTVIAIAPADHAVDVSLVTPIVVTFSEPIDPATVSDASFAVKVGTTAVQGTLAFQSGNTVRFIAAQPYPADAVITTQLTTAITDRFGNALATPDGTSSQTFTFTTGRFSVTSPSGDVVENTVVTLEARASAALGVASVLFTVNGAVLPVASGSPFVATFNVGAASATNSLTIVASGRNASGVEIARDVKTVDVVVGLTVTPGLSGLAIGAQGSLRFSLSSALDQDLPITVTVGNPAILTAPANPVILPAGATHVDAAIGGAAEGATSVVGRSSHGDAGAIVAVSPLRSGSTQLAFAPAVGVALPQPAAVAVVALKAGAVQTLIVDLLAAVTGSATPVTVTSSNTSIVTASADPIPGGSRAAQLVIRAGANGVATLIVRAGDRAVAITVFVGPPPPGLVPPIVAAPVGFAIVNPPNAGRIVMTAGRQTVVSIAVLAAPATGVTPVTVSTSAASVATATAGDIQPGETVTQLTVNAAADGVATLIVRAGGEVRTVTIFVGTPPPGSTPIAFADAVGVSVIALPTIGKAFAPANASRTVVIALFDTPVATDTLVTVTSSDPAIVSAASPAVVPAGGQSVQLTLVTGGNGLATLTLEGGGLRRQLLIESGRDPTPRTSQPIVAAPVAFSLRPNGSAGGIVGPKDAVASATVTVPLLAAAAGGPTPVHVTSSNTQVALVAGGAAVDVVMNAGEQVVNLSLLTTGTEGAAVITFEFGGERRELLVIVGAPTQIPAVTAPAVGVRIGG